MEEKLKNNIVETYTLTCTPDYPGLRFRNANETTSYKTGALIVAKAYRDMLTRLSEQM